MSLNIVSQEQNMLVEGSAKKVLKEQLRHGTSVYPIAAYYWQNSPYNHRVSLHWHPEVEIVRFVKGSFTYAVSGQDQLRIENEAIMVIPGNVLHTITLPPQSIETAVVFDLNMLNFEHYDELQSDIFAALSSGNMPLPPVIRPDNPGFVEAAALYDYIITHCRETDAPSRLIVKAKILELLALLYSHGYISRKEVLLSVNERNRQNKLKELLTYIDAHYAGPMTVADAAARLNVSIQYFCRYFKKVTSMCFTDYLNDLRLRRAAQAIVETDQPIGNIATHHGFDNSGYFFKNFKEKYGTTPLKYRKTMRQQEKERSEAVTQSLQDLPPAGMEPVPLTESSA